MKATSALLHSRPLAEENASRIAVVAALSATSMLFASLASAYIVRRSFADWQVAAASWPWVLLLFGVGASATVELASRLGGPGGQMASPEPARQRRAGRRALAGLAAISALYLAGALGVIGSIAQSESGLSRPHDAFIVLLLGVHVVHALLGGAFSVRLLRTPGHEPTAHAWLLVRLVTHFLTLLLLAILALLFFPR